MESAQLHILAPGMTAPIRGVQRLSPPLSAPVLERFLSRADQHYLPGMELESTLCHLFGISRAEGGDFPIAALRRVGDLRRPPDERCWLQAEPVCLRPDQSRLLLFDTREFDVSAAELRALATLFIDHFQAEAWLAEVDDPRCWYLSPHNTPTLRSFPLGDVLGRNMALFLPRGEERLYWHRMLNEVQMLFFNAEVNQMREAAGKMPIGGLWFSGFGSLPQQIDSPFTQVCAADPLSAGLARLSGVPLERAPASVAVVPQRPGASLIVYPDLQRPVWRADLVDWVKKIAQFETWLAPWLQELAQGRLNEVNLYPCDGRLFRLTRWPQRYRIWRQTKPLTAWLQQEHPLS